MISLFPSNIIGSRRQTRHGGTRLYGIGHTRRQRIPIPHIWNFPHDRASLRARILFALNVSCAR
jgi:hypothetical protein